MRHDGGGGSDEPVVRLLRSRDDFKREVALLGLLFSDFSTSPAHVWQAALSTLPKAVQAVRNVTILDNIGITFSHLGSGLPFDFTLQPGLIQIANQPAQKAASQARRRLHELHRASRKRSHRPHHLDGLSRRSLLSIESALFANVTDGRDGPASALRRPRSRASSQSESRHAFRAPDQIRFAHAQRVRAASAVAAAAAAVLPSNGGDDFTFSFPHETSDIYEVLAFGFELLDDGAVDGLNRKETLSIFGTNSRLLATLRLREKRPTEDVGCCFVGVISRYPIGFASFDDSADDEQIGLARFAFGYRERTSHTYPAVWWWAAAAALAGCLAFEQAVLRARPAIELPTATAWALVWVGLIVAACALLWGLVARSQGVLFLSCLVLNSMLSGDNLFVFMLLLEQVQLHRSHHLRAVSDGMVAALPVRMLILVCGAAILERCSWLLSLFGVFLLGGGLKLVLSPDEAPDAAAREEQVDAPPHWSLRCVQALVPLHWSDSTDGDYVARNENGALCATRLLVVVCGITLSDVFFAMDSTPVLLTVTTSPFILVLSLSMSLLALRPVYFMLAALAEYVGSMQQVLGVVLVLIGAKILVEAAGGVVPTSLFVATIVGWRLLVGFWALAKCLCCRPAAMQRLSELDGDARTWDSRRSPHSGASAAERSKAATHASGHDRSDVSHSLLASEDTA